MTRILTLDGITTNQIGTTDVMQTVVDEFLKNVPQSSHTVIPYPAAMMGVGGPESWTTSTEIGLNNLLRVIQETEDKIVLVGYSGGCKPVHEFLSRHPEFHEQITAVGFVSDPWRPRTRWQNGTPNPEGFGIMGEDFGPIADRTYWTSAKGDPISGAKPDSLLRYMADVCEGEIHQVPQAFLTLAQTGRLQLPAFLGLPFPQWFFGLGPRITNAVQEAHSYLNGGHDRAYVVPFVTDGSKSESLSARLGATLAFKHKKVISS